MKKFLTIMLISLSLTGCGIDYNTHSSSDMDEVDVIRGGISIRKFIYEGHRYLRFDSYCVIHDPNCECFSEE